MEMASYEPSEGSADGTFEVGVTISGPGIQDKEFIELGRLLDMLIVDEGEIWISGIHGNDMSIDLGPRNQARLKKTIMAEAYRIGFDVERIPEKE